MLLDSINFLNQSVIIIIVLADLELNFMDNIQRKAVKMPLQKLSLCQMR